jgi:AraC-like DNA-binding protein
MASNRLLTGLRRGAAVAAVTLVAVALGLVPHSRAEAGGAGVAPPSRGGAGPRRLIRIRVATYPGVVRPDELKHLRRARDLIDREYARPLDVPALALAAFMSPAHFSRQFRAAYGETPYSYLMTRRIERAKALLRRGDLSVTDVCMAVGCTSLGSFSARFTELVGETPSAYRARNHAALATIPGCWAKLVTRPSRNREAQVSPAS